MPTEKNRNFAAQLPINLAVNIAYFQTNVVVGILLVLYLLSIPGFAAYNSLTISISEYIAILVQFLNTAISRYHIIPPRREDYNVANRSYYKAIIITVCHKFINRVLYHSNDFKAIVKDLEKITGPVVAFNKVVQISSTGVA